MELPLICRPEFSAPGRYDYILPNWVGLLTHLKVAPEQVSKIQKIRLNVNGCTIAVTVPQQMMNFRMKIPMPLGMRSRCTIDVYSSEPVDIISIWEDFPLNYPQQGMDLGITAPHIISAVNPDDTYHVNVGKFVTSHGRIYEQVLICSYEGMILKYCADGSLLGETGTPKA
jgi:hypothetical protein